MVGWNSNTKLLKEFGDELGKTAGCASPESKKHSVECQRRQEEWKSKTFPQPERATRSEETGKRQDTQPASSSITIHTPATDARDLDQPKHGDDTSMIVGSGHLCNESE